MGIAEPEPIASPRRPRQDPWYVRWTLTLLAVGIDPAGTANRRSDETGIIVVGAAGKNLYVLHDGSGKFSAGQRANYIDK